jgi:hypothetical protein
VSSPHLADYVDNAEFGIRRATSKLSSEPSLEVALQNSFFHRQKGVCEFLRTGRPARFFDSMQRSAGSFLHFVTHAPAAEKLDSETEPLFDAINGGFWDCARAIAQHARAEWDRNAEYEDDFLYARFLHSHFFGEAADDAAGEQILDAYENVLEGATDTRLDLCRAFHDEDEAAFGATLSVFLDERAERLEASVERETIGEDVWSWSRYFCSEGLALLKLAEHKRFTVGKSLSQVPEALRRHPEIEFDPELWRTGP